MPRFTLFIITALIIPLLAQHRQIAKLMRE